MLAFVNRPQLHLPPGRWRAGPLAVWCFGVLHLLGVVPTSVLWCACSALLVPSLYPFTEFPWEVLAGRRSPTCVSGKFSGTSHACRCLKLCLETCVTMLAAVTLCVCGHSYLVACSPVGCGSPFTGSPSGSPSQGCPIPLSVVCSRVEYLLSASPDKALRRVLALLGLEFSPPLLAYPESVLALRCSLASCSCGWYGSAPIPWTVNCCALACVSLCLALISAGRSLWGRQVGYTSV